MEDDWIVGCITRKKEKGLELLIDQTKSTEMIKT